MRVETHPLRLGPDNAEAMIRDYDLVADGSDNFETRYLLTDLCYRLEKPLVAAALSPFEGQLSTFKPYLGAGHPCYRCLFRDPPPPDLVPRCETAGILGAVAGVLGTLQAVEVLKELLQLGESLDGTLLIYDALRARFHSIRIAKDPDCPTCGARLSLARAWFKPQGGSGCRRGSCAAGTGRRRGCAWNWPFSTTILPRRIVMLGQAATSWPSQGV